MTMNKKIYTMDQLRAAHVQMAVVLQPKFFLTLATNQHVGLEQMKTWTRMFLQLMDKRMLGNKFFKHEAKERMDGLFYIEHEASNIHVHGLITGPYSNRIGLQLCANEVWGKVCPSGSVLIKDIGDVEVRSKYCTKEYFRSDFFDRQFFVGSEFMSAA
jgi:hypothetical protein